jgi:hypothetical protein
MRMIDVLQQCGVCVCVTANHLYIICWDLCALVETPPAQGTFETKYVIVVQQQMVQNIKDDAKPL